jgi:hypothetical protein
VTATSADGWFGGWVVRVVVGRVEGVGEGVDCVPLEVEPYVGVDADVGVAEDFLDDGEVDAAKCSRF